MTHCPSPMRRRTCSDGARAAPRLACARAAALSVAALLGACIGPPYKVPHVDTPSAFKESAAAQYQGADQGAWQPARPQDAALKGKWWEIFGEPELDALEEQLDINNQTIAEYFQNFMAARAQVAEARAQYFPTLTASPSVTRTHTPSTVTGGTSVAGATGAGGTPGTSTYNNIQLPLDVSWEPDLFGRIRNTVKEYRYAAQVSAADLENERLTEQASLAEYFFEIRGQDSLQNLYDLTIAADKKSLELTRALYETGIDTDEDVAEAEVTLANAEATAIGIATNRAIYEHAIAMLIGKPAAQFSMPVRGLTAKIPAIPVGVPSQLLQRRPDVAAAERTMAEANALIGVETAAYFPTLDLTASGGFESAILSNLITTPARFWSLGASASETLFDAGLRAATLRQYDAQFQADVALYRQTVLTAFQQVEDYIATLRIGSQQLARQQAAVGAAERYVKIATARWETGLDPYLDVMTAELTLLSDQETLVTEQVNVMLGAVQLIQALGGGWDTTQLPSPTRVTSQSAANQLSKGP